MRPLPIGAACNARLRAGGRAIALATAAWVLAVPAQAQLRIQPTFSTQLTLTDNRDLSSTNRKSDAIWQLSPGLSVRSNSGAFQGSINLALNETLYARDLGRSTLQTTAAGVFRLDAVPRQAWLDGSVSVSQQSISAFGLQSPWATQINANSSQVTTIMLAPALAGRLGGVVDARARVAWTGTRSDGTSAGNMDSVASTVGLGSRFGLFGWALDAGHLVSGPKGEPQTTQDTAIASLSFMPAPELQLSLRHGWEKDDFGGVLSTSSSFWGFGVNWFPTERTSVSLQRDKRFFGSSYAFNVTHRMARSIWSYTDSRALSGGDLLNTDARSLLDRYQQAFNNCMLAFGQNPQATALCEMLARASVGLDPMGTGGFLSSAQAVERAQTLSVALRGVRTTVTLSASRTESERLQNVTYAIGDLSLVNRIRQHVGSVSVSHRLTPSASLTLTATDQRTADAGPLAGNELLWLTAALSESLTPRITGTLMVRHTRYSSPSNPYTESAIVGSIGMTF